MGDSFNKWVAHYPIKDTLDSWWNSTKGNIPCAPHPKPRPTTEFPGVVPSRYIFFNVYQETEWVVKGIYASGIYASSYTIRPAQWGE